MALMQVKPCKPWHVFKIQKTYHLPQDRHCSGFLEPLFRVFPGLFRAVFLIESGNKIGYKVVISILGIPGGRFEGG